MKRLATIKLIAIAVIIPLALSACDSEGEPELTTTSSVVGQTTEPGSNTTTTVGSDDSSTTTTSAVAERVAS